MAMLAAGAFAGAQTTPPKTVWDGVYTEAQAERATGVFGTTCSNCHTLDPKGNRPLVGDTFWSGYSQRTVGDLITFVRTNMPNGNGGSLPTAVYYDLVALILKSNGLPAGSTELSPDAAGAAQIVSKDGPGQLPAGTLARVVGCLGGSGRDWTLTQATAPERIDKSGVGPDDATRPLGEGTIALKFVLTRLDAFKGARMSVSGLLIGAGGADGINVSTVERVGETCP